MMKVEYGVVDVQEEHCRAALGSKAGLLIFLDLDLVGTRCSVLDSANPSWLNAWSFLD